MAITLGDLRTFCQEVASPDISGSTADREINIWINSAIQKLYSAQSWNRLLKRTKIYLPAEETGSELTATNGSLTITLGAAETFDSKYVTELWALHVDDEDLMSFRLASIDDSPTNQTATLEAGGNWTSSTGSSKSYTFTKDIYDLPNDAKQIHRVQLLQTHIHLTGIPAHEFDTLRQGNPTQRGGGPRFYCIRENKLEIWPAPGSDDMTLGVSYRRGAPIYATTDADSTEVAWPEEWKYLLEKALILQASFFQGEHAPIPYNMAKIEYEQELNTCRGLDSKMDNMSGPMMLKLGRAGVPRGSIRSISYDGPVTESG